MTPNEAKEIFDHIQPNTDQGEQSLKAWISQRTIPELIVIIEPLIHAANSAIENDNLSIKAFLSLYGISKILELIANSNTLPDIDHDID